MIYEEFKEHQLAQREKFLKQEGKLEQFQSVVDFKNNQIQTLKANIERLEKANHKLFHTNYSNN